MKLPVQFLPEATSEFTDSVEWYERRRPGLGVDFLSKVDEIIDRIAESPEFHPAVYGDIRKVVIPRFPYVVLYRKEAGQLLIISVFHTARDPSAWKSRA